MRQPLGSSGSNTVRSRSIPAPVGGWNASDSIADMSAKDAVYLDNFFPRTSDVMLRKGFTDHAELAALKEIRTVMGYKSPAAVVKLFAAAQDGIYDVTAGGVIGAAVTAATNAAWEYTPVTTAGGSFLLMCNGVDKMKLYDGAVWTDLDGVSVPAITGITTTDVVNIAKFKTRVILCKKDSLSFYYLPNNAIAGAATEFPLGALFGKGGYLMATATWTLDGGNGPDDYFVAITSEGEVVVYKGTDPSAAATFALVGVFQLAKPMSRRCFVKMASDTAVITQDAIYPLSKSLGITDTERARPALTRKIQKVYNEFAQLYSGLFGWSITVFPEASMLLVNVPVVNYAPRNIIYSYQFVMNTMTGAWCRFTDMNAECFTAFDGKLYFALHNHVYQAWNGMNDDGAVIVGKGKTAFNHLGTSGSKHITMLRPLIQAGASIELQLGIDTDYEDTTLQSSSASYVQSLSLWNSAVWNTAKWNGNSLVISKWRTAVCKMGRVAATRLRCAAKDVIMTWIATDLQVEDADGL